MLNYIYTLVFFIIFCNNTEQQQNGIPHIPCPNYFQYFREGSQFFGRILLPNVSHNIKLSIHFAQRTPLQKNYPVKKLLSLESSQPFQYRMDFPSPNEVPILTKISVNDQDICFSNDYPPGSTTFFINHDFHTNIRITPLNQPQSSLQPQTSFQPQTFNQLLPKTQPVKDDIARFMTYTLPEIYPNALQMQPFEEFAQPIQPVTQSPKKVPQISLKQIGSIPAESFKQPAPQNVQCGEETNIAPFVVGGEELSRGQFPWLTAVYHIQDSSLKFLCGGTLVSARTVVSAGHCVKRNRLSAERLVVHLGRYNLEDFSDQSYVTRPIKKLIVHPEYNQERFADADLAILQLESSVEYTNYIRPICLWSEPSDISRIVGQTGVVAGWGADGNGHSTTPIPKKVNTDIVSGSECLQKSSASLISLISERTFCAGNRDGTGPCMGDSGSGLMIYRDRRWYLRGIVSAGLTKQQTCDLDEFVVFCDVAKHLQWLRNQMVS